MQPLSAAPVRFLLAVVDPAVVCSRPGADPAVPEVSEGCLALVGRGAPAWMGELVVWLSRGWGRVLLVLALVGILVRIARWIIVRTERRVTLATLSKTEGLSPDELAATATIGLARATQRTRTLAAVAQACVSILAVGWVVVAVAGAAGINLGPLLAGAGVAGIALGFGAQTLFRDLLAGLGFLAEDAFGVGDVVDVGGGVVGEVERVGLRTTWLRDVHGTTWVVPNGEIKRAGNLSQRWARAVVDFDIPYDTPLADSISVLKSGLGAAVARRRDLVIGEVEVWGVEAFTDAGVRVRLATKTAPGRQWEAQRYLRMAGKEALDVAGIPWPAPRRDLGGQPTTPTTRPGAAPLPEEGTESEAS